MPVLNNNMDSIQGEFKSLIGRNLYSFRNNSRVKMLHLSTNEGNIFLDSADLMVWNLMFFWYGYELF